MSAREAQKEVQNIALDSNFAVPGDPGFPLNQVGLASRLSSSASRAKTGTGGWQCRTGRMEKADR